MADRAPSTSRRAVLGAAAALPVLPLLVRPERSRGALLPPAEADWHARLTRYETLYARAKSAAETGWFRTANDRFNAETATPAADHESAFTRITRAEDLYWRRCTAPMQQAAAALVQTPAPTLTALRQKLAAIRTHQLHEEGSMERDCIEVLEEDVGQLSKAC